MIFTAKKVQQKLKTFLPALVISLALTSCETSSSTKSPVEITYQFHSTVTYLPEGTNGTAGTTATYCYFGDWPQTIKENNVAVYENQSITMGGERYYAGSDGNWYAKCKENAYKADFTYSDGTIASQADRKSTKYFKVEAIKWRVLNPTAENENKLLLAEYALVADIPYYDYNEVNRTINDKTIYPNNYEHSKIRAYLNGISYIKKESDNSEQTTNSDYLNKGFLHTAFTNTAQDLIAATDLDNSAASTNPASTPTQWNDGENQYICNTTKDKIFLLSEKEVTTSEYGFAEFNVYIDDGYGTTESNRTRKATDYTIANHCWQDDDEYDWSLETYNTLWWLRSPRADLCDYVAHDVSYSGEARCSCIVNDGTCSIVPALSISAN